jgi:hypothetical protein
MPTPRNSLVLLALLAALLAPGCETPGDRRGKVEQPERDVAYLVRRGMFLEAVYEAEELYRKNPDDPEAEEAYRLASTAWLLEQGRRELFADNDQAALELFLRAQEIAPEQELVQDWIDNASNQLAITWHDRGIAWQMGDELEKARDCYEKALEYRPDFPRAQASLYRILLQMNYREGMSLEYYDDGVRAYHDLMLDEAAQFFGYSKKYDPGNERALERREVTRTELARQRVYIAYRHEAEGRFAAARNEFRMALLLDDDLPEALEGFERMSKEAEAADHVREAERKILRGEYLAAEAAIAKGRALTQVQDEALDLMLQGIAEARLEDKYQDARTLESDQQFVAAVAAYDELLEQAPYFRDAIARRDTLQSYIEHADELYAQAMEAGSEDERLRILRRIDVFWPDYRDVRELLQAADGR